MSEATDLDLVRQVQGGDQAAYGLLVGRYQQRLAALVSRYVFDQDEISDVVQEALIKAYRGLHGFRGDSAFYTWLYRIAVNTAKNYLTEKSRRGQEIQADFSGDGAYLLDRHSHRADPEALAQERDLNAAINEAFRALPGEHGMALALREFDGLSYEEIAKVMDCPVGTVRSRIFRAREMVDQSIRHLLQSQTH